MSSILTNNSAMVALQTLQGINKNLATTQNEISTGKSIFPARPAASNRPSAATGAPLRASATRLQAAIVCGQPNA